MTDGSAESLRSLAGLLRSGLTLRRALARWPDEAHPAVAADAALIARRVRLGGSTIEAVCGTRFERLSAAFSFHQTHGIDLALWLDEVAADLEESAAASASARAATAGAILSGRMVAGLPLLFVPLTPINRAAMLDAVGIAILAGGVALAVAGLRWIGRLMPTAPPADPVGKLCGSVAALLDAGLPLPVALQGACSEFAGEVPELGDAARLVRLGWTWQAALARCDSDFGPLCRSIAQAREHGLRVADALRALQRNRRSETLREFDRRLKRAPVLMVVPLTCCVLPAFGLLGLAPFLRSMSLG